MLSNLIENFPLEIAKCKSSGCYPFFVTNWFPFFPERFISFPTFYDYGPNGMEVVESNVALSNTEVLASSINLCTSERVIYLKLEIRVCFGICRLTSTVLRWQDEGKSWKKYLQNIQ